MPQWGFQQVLMCVAHCCGEGRWPKGVVVAAQTSDGGPNHPH